MLEPITYLSSDYFLSPIELTDKQAHVEWLNEAEFHQNMDNIANPFTENDAKEWLKSLESKLIDQKPMVLAIRRSSDKKLIGSIGIYHSEPSSTQIVEIGYWLAKPYWGQGIISKAIEAFVKYSFEELNVLRIFAKVFDRNISSWRVLEKAGFKLEGIQRQHIYREGEFLDDRLYGLLKSEWLAKS